MTMTVREARDRFLGTYGFDTAGYTAPRFSVPIGRWTITTPNPGALPIHDLHHVATGFPATLIGEAEVSAFELRSGMGMSPFIFILCAGAIFLGLFRSPRSRCRIMAAWKHSCGTRNLYRTTVPYGILLDMDLESLRTSMGLPVGGIGEL